ncbi:MAG: twin-arginine translocation signal domain-containing protein [Alphaproteobacteria bacterium]|nr:twin-arginine translocation signal domain-containing protein [Alphaproteobacteria bacterium]
MKKIPTKQNTSQKPACSSRRNFLKLCAAGAAVIATSGSMSVGAESLKSLTPYSTETANTLIEPDSNKENFMGIDIYYTKELELEIVKENLQFLNDMPKKLYDAYGIKFDEPKRILDNFRESGTPIAVTSKTKTEAGFAGFEDGSAILCCNSDYYLEKYDSTYSEAFSHEMLHNKQFHEEAKQYFSEKGFSKNNIKRLNMEREKTAFATGIETRTMQFLLEKHEQSGGQATLEDLTKEYKGLTAEELISTTLEPDYCAELLVLREIAQKGSEAVSNGDTKRAALTVVTGQNKYNGKIQQRYKKQVNRISDRYERHTDKDAASNPDKNIDDIIERLYLMDSRFTPQKPAFTKDSPYHPSSDENNKLFDTIVKDISSFFDRLFRKNKHH